jgi:hypothetical protein
MPLAEIHYFGFIGNLIDNAETLGKINAVELAITHSHLWDKHLG